MSNSYSNCLFLEERGWTGIGVDVEHIDAFNSHRKGKGIKADMMITKIQDILDANNAPSVIDYFSYDVDPAMKPSLESLSFDKYKFKIIHFEHNEYIKDDPSYKDLKQLGKDKFLSAGYKLIVDNLLDDRGDAVEDWYIHPDFFADVRPVLSNIYHRAILTSYGYSYSGLYHYYNSYFN
jgi:hypothetical protein